MGIRASDKDILTVMVSHSSSSRMRRRRLSVDSDSERMIKFKMLKAGIANLSIPGILFHLLNAFGETLPSVCGELQN